MTKILVLTACLIALSGVAAATAINGIVWYDKNCNGNLENGEGMNGIEVKLYESNGNFVASTNTASNSGVPGYYYINIPTAIQSSGTIKYYYIQIEDPSFRTFKSDCIKVPFCNTIRVNAPLCKDVCPRSPGYWKNHPDAWPVDEITIGGVTYQMGDTNTEGTALYYMSQPVKKDKTITMFKSLVAAKLNGGYCDPCIANTVYAADQWMKEHPIEQTTRANTCCWERGEPLNIALDAYNNGQL
ncbi:SdrD B-like domain-containing protein [Methanosarcina sp. 1.H.T.1A.1]|uniref:SdrD B-like domain-containing protein n=1 Tax=Methanosarcina sp. 1.H.T.1A.1 TaxID=1483602 RepID=UPI00138E4338|nr:SdrD B-like domain-containing protein [Methanosarcina sp. 1.H.T.1A.1]